MADCSAQGKPILEREDLKSTLEGLHDAAVAVVDDFEALSSARNPLEFARHITDLSNRVADLSSWLEPDCWEHGWRAHEEES